MAELPHPAGVLPQWLVWWSITDPLPELLHLVLRRACPVVH